jgi:hypothetical protein
MEAHGCDGAGVGINFENCVRRVVGCGVGAVKEARCQGRADHTRGECQAALERAGEDEKLGSRS